jgi:hypothetical protein
MLARIWLNARALSAAISASFRLDGADAQDVSRNVAKSSGANNLFG